jgi:uncharacterized protein DUF6932
MIPTLVGVAGAPWRVLPPGIHAATFSEVQVTFAVNTRRREIFEGLLDGAGRLRCAGCVKLFLDGSYVSAKPIPGDYDACWDPAGVDEKRLDPVFRDFTKKREAQKKRFLGEFFPSTMFNTSKQTFVELFQKEKFTGRPKGILMIVLSSKDPLLSGRIAP